MAKVNKLKVISDNVQNFQAILILSNRDELEKERDVLNQLDHLSEEASKELKRLEDLYSLHPDIPHIKSNYLKQENRVKEILVAREMSEEAVKQFEKNLEDLGEKV